MKNNKSVLVILFTLSLFSVQSIASVCFDVFPDAASSYTNTGGVVFEANAALIGNDTSINIPITQDDSNRSCTTASCTYSGNQSGSLLLNSFFLTSSSQDITVSANGTRTINQGAYDDILVYRNAVLTVQDNDSITRFDSLYLDEYSDLILHGGIYWIDSLQVEYGADIIINGSDKVTLYVNNAILADNVDFNWDGDPEQLVIISYNNFNTGFNTDMRGYLYTNGDVNWGDSSDFFGAINAENIILGANGDFTYEAAGLVNAQFDGTCLDNSSLPVPALYYSMDLCNQPTNSIDDEVASNNAIVNGNVGIGYTGNYCQNANLDGISSFLDIPDSSLFNLSEGTFSTWVYVPSLTHSGSPFAGRMTLFSKDNSYSDAGGVINLWIGDFGNVYLEHGDSSYYYPINTANGVISEFTWHHIAYTFGPSGGRLYVDGTLQGYNAANSIGFSSDGNAMAIGANTWNYSPFSSTPREDQLYDYLWGAIDEFKIFDEQLGASQIDQLYNLSSQACTDCSNDPVLVSHWSADVCSFQADALIDVESGHNGIIRQGVTNQYASRFCQGLLFDGNASYATIAHNDDMKVADGAISMWFRLSDLSHKNDSFVDGQGLFAKDSVNFADGGHINLVVKDTGAINVRHQSTSSSVTMTTNPVVQENTWHHLVYSFGGNGTQIFVDGNLIFNLASHTNGLQLNQDDIVLGATSQRRTRGNFDQAQYDDFMLGEMDEIKLYRNQPSTQDVQSWYNQASSSCTTCDSLVAHYSFDDESVSGSQIQDISGNNRHATLPSSLSLSIPDDNIYCQAMDTSSNTSFSEKEFLETSIDLNDLGNQGSISLWYRHNADWNDGAKRMIFDASTEVDGTTQDKFFFLSKLADGRLEFGLEDTSDNDMQFRTFQNNFSADEWVHIGVSWNLTTRDYKVFLNGQERAGTFSTNNISRTLADFETLTFGDNRTDYNVIGLTGNASNGQIDDIRIYAQAVSQSQFESDMNAATPCASVHHYEIIHPTTALTCSNPSVTIRACANEDCSELSTDESLISLTPIAAWSNSSISFTGSTQVQLQHRSSGTLTIASSSQNPVAPVQCSDNCEIEYEDAGLEFFHISSASTDFSTSPFIAEAGLSELGLRMVSNNGGACGALTSGTETIDISYQCISPSGQPYSPSACTRAFAGIGLSAGPVNSGSLDLVFDANGESNFGAFNYPDVGVVQINASATIEGANVQAASATLYFVPDRLELSSDATDLLRAGEEFSLQIDALGANGNLLPSYQNADMQASVQRILPNDSDAVDAAFYFAGAINSQTSASINYSGLAGLTFASGRMQSSSAYIEEIGSYVLRMRDNDYLGQIISSNELSLGRFIPAYFDVQLQQQPAFAPSCSADFTYVGQAFEYAIGSEPEFVVTAYNAKNRITQNYSSSLWRLLPSQSVMEASLAYTDTSVYSGALDVLNLGTGPAINGSEVFDGSAVLSIANSQFSYAKIANPSGSDATPFNANANMTVASNFFTDTDGVCYVSSYPGACEDFTVNSITGTELRYGRLVAENSYGSENQTLRVPLRAEYLVDGQWRSSDTDACTDINLSMANGDFSVIHDSQSPNNISTQITTVSASGNLMAGLSDENDVLIAPVLVNGNPIRGALYLQLNPRNVANHWSQFLNIDWDQDGDIDQDDTVSAAVSFGLYRGNDKTIHWREVF